MDPNFALLSDAARIATAGDIELATALSNCLTSTSSSLQQRRSAVVLNSGGSTLLPTLNLDIVYILVQKLVKTSATTNTLGEKENNNNNNNESEQTENNSAELHFCSQQLKVLIATFFVTAARHENLSIQHWFQTPSSSSSSSSPNVIKDATIIESIVTLLLEGLSRETHSMVVGEVLRLFLQFSPSFLQIFVAYRRAPSGANNNNSAQLPSLTQTASSSSNNPTQVVVLPRSTSPSTLVSPRSQPPPQQTATIFLFEDCAIGMIAPMLTDSMALKNHSAWQVLLAVLQSDVDTLRPSKQVVELLAKHHLHSFLNLLVSCLRHANPASRRFSLRLISDILQLFSDWQPISHCILQSPAIFFALLANAEPPTSVANNNNIGAGGGVSSPLAAGGAGGGGGGGAAVGGASCLDQSQVYHILKMFIMFPKKCPLMRHLCYLNRDSLGLYTQRAASKANSKEVEMIMSKLETTTPLTAEEAALIQCAF